MKSIESRLGTQAAPRPERALSPDFTTRTMGRIQQRRAAKSIFTRLASPFKGVPLMHKLTKPAAFGLGLMVLAVITGTGVANVLWSRPSVELDKAYGITTLENGHKLFRITFSSCQGQHHGLPRQAYYEMRPNASISINELTKGLVVSCEADLLAELFPEAIGHSKSETHPPFRPGDDQHIFPYARFKRLDGNSAVVDTGLNGFTYHDVKVPIDKDARFYEKGQMINVRKLRPGSYLTLVVHTTALDVPYSTEAMRPDELNKISKDGLPLGARLQGAIQHVYNPEDASKMYQTMGRDWTRVEADKNAPSGWRQIVPLHE